MAQPRRRLLRRPAPAAPPSFSGSAALTRSLAAFRKSPALFLTIAAITYIPIWIILGAASFLGDPGKLVSDLGFYGVLGASKLFVIFTAGPAGALVLQYSNETNPSLRSALVYCKNRWRSLLITSFVTAAFAGAVLLFCLLPAGLLYLNAATKVQRESAFEVISFAGVACGVLGGALFHMAWARWCLATPAALAEGGTSVDALTRSQQLSSGQRDTLALFGATIFILYLIVELSIFTILGAALGERERTWPRLFVTETLALPFPAVGGIFVNICYQNLRDGMDGAAERSIVEVFQ